MKLKLAKNILLCYSKFSTERRMWWIDIVLGGNIVGVREKKSAEKGV
jgi:hypothetical protein